MCEHKRSAGGTRICDQSRRRMVSTDSTRKPWVWPLYSVTIMTSRAVSLGNCANLARSTTGTSAPRRLTMPSTATGMSGAAVSAGVRMTSRTLNTLMPNVSRRPVRVSTPSENISISSLLVPASLVRASIFLSNSDMSASSVWSVARIQPGARRFTAAVDQT